MVQNVVILGPPGVGKTHRAVGPSLKAIEKGYRVLHHAITINILGNSYRLKDKLKAGLIRAEEPAVADRSTGVGNS